MIQVHFRVRYFAAVRPVCLFFQLPTKSSLHEQCLGSCVYTALLGLHLLLALSRPLRAM